jgi:hypothetical protein
MQHGMMNSTGSQQDAGFLPAKEKDIGSLAEAKPSETMDVKDGDAISLNPTIVRKTINGKEIAMYADQVGEMLKDVYAALKAANGDTEG